jgi:hypothetical protein
VAPVSIPTSRTSGRHRSRRDSRRAVRLHSRWCGHCSWLKNCPEHAEQRTSANRYTNAKQRHANEYSSYAAAYNDCDASVRYYRNTHTHTRSDSNSDTHAYGGINSNTGSNTDTDTDIDSNSDANTMNRL